MQFVAPDILGLMCGLSVGVCAVGLGIGAALWLFGWWAHRFWIVLATTVLAGITGLQSGHAAGMQPFVAGLLLAVAAGLMALALARLLAFIGGGMIVLAVMRATLPAWEEPLICFLAGGLVGLLLFRWWTMAASSAAGTLIMVYSGLALADRLGKINALDWAENRTLLLNWVCGGLALTGVVAQLLLERWKSARNKKKAEEEQLARAELELDQQYQKRKSSWWGKKGRRAA
jgi:MFS family permease